MRQDFNLDTCMECPCYGCNFNAHVKPDETSHIAGGRIMCIPLEKKCIGCSYCYANGRQTPHSECTDYSRSNKHTVEKGNKQ